MSRNSKRASYADHQDLAAAIGIRLRAFRMEARYSQEALSALSGINRSGLSDIENAHRPVDAIELIILARVYNTTVDDLLAVDSTRPSAEPHAAVAMRLADAATRLEQLERRLSALTLMADDPTRNDPGSSPPDPSTVWPYALRNPTPTRTRP